MNELRTNSHVKVIFRIESDADSVEVESVWAVPVENGYQIDNIPFYVRGFAWGDVVTVTPDADGLLRCTGLARASMHSTVRLWFEDASCVQGVRDELRAMGCDSELNRTRLVAVDVPPEVPYERVRAYLDDQEQAGLFEYEEGCLGQSQS